MGELDPLLPLWFATAALGEACVAGEPLEQGPFDVVVVGAGVTGASTALHLAGQGARVLVLERDAPGQGTSGRSNGQILAGLQQAPHSLIKAYGETRGERLVRFAGDAPDLVFDLVRRHGIACDAERAGWIQATRWSRGRRALDALAAEYAQRGAPVRTLEREEVQRLLGTRAYAGGWLDARCGSVQPLAYARGLARAATRAGAVLRCGCQVTGLQRSAGQWRLDSTAGVVSAPIVVLATNVRTRELPGIAGECVGRSFLSSWSVQLASEPLTPEQRAQVLPQRHNASDTEHLRLRYFRLDAAGRFVIGGPGWLRPPASPAALSFRWLERSARRMFPALGEVRFTHRWAARDSLTADLVPHLYEPAPGLLAAVGFNGRGLAIGTALGSVLARRALGEALDALPFPCTTPSRVPFNLPEALRFWLGTARRRFHH